MEASSEGGLGTHDPLASLGSRMSSDGRQLSHQSCQFFDTQSRFRSIALKSDFGLHARLVSALVAGELLGLEQKRTTTTRR